MFEAREFLEQMLVVAQEVGLPLANDIRQALDLLNTEQPSSRSPHHQADSCSPSRAHPADD